MADWRHTTTERLRLDQPTSADLEDLHRIHADPLNWGHFPQGRHLDLARTAVTLEQSDAQWQFGLGYWCLRTADDDRVVGWRVRHAGGLRVVEPLLPPRLRGPRRGYAVEVARHALVAARDVDPTGR